MRQRKDTFRRSWWRLRAAGRRRRQAVVAVGALVLVGSLFLGEGAVRAQGFGEERAGEERARGWDGWTRSDERVSVRARRNRPRRWRVKVGAGAHQMFVRDSSFDILKEDDLLAFGQVDVAGELRLWRGVVVGFATHYCGADTKESLFEDLEVTTEIHSLSLMPFAGYRLWGFVFPYVRTGFVGTWLELGLSGEGTSRTREVFAPGVGVAGGLEVTLPRRYALKWLTGGVRLEAGYTYLGKFDFPSHGGGGSLVETTWSSLGTLTLRGASLGVSVFASF